MTFFCRRAYILFAKNMLRIVPGRRMHSPDALRVCTFCGCVSTDWLRECRDAAGGRKRHALHSMKTNKKTYKTTGRLCSFYYICYHEHSCRRQEHVSRRATFLQTIKSYNDMETKENGYRCKKYDFPTKRFCQMLDLRNDPELIAEYVKVHSEESVWKEVLDNMRNIGILEMEIYLLDNRLFMIVETPEDFDWDKRMGELAEIPVQKRWEEFTSRFQQTEGKDEMMKKWKMMERIFHIYDK